MHVVAVGVRFAGEDVAYDQSFESSANALHFLHAFDFEANGCQCICYFLSRQLHVDILLKPFIRNIHLFDDLTILTIYFFDISTFQDFEISR